MTSHSYGYDINRIIALANGEGNDLVEGYALQLDHLLSEESNIPEKFIEETIEFLYGLIGA